MKVTQRGVLALLCVLIIFSTFTPITNALKVEKANNATLYYVPLISNEVLDDSLLIYEFKGKQYLDLKDIAALTRSICEQDATSITITHGIRILKIDLTTCELDESGIKNQGIIDVKEWYGVYLCEAVPMLTYLGADCSINEKLGCFQVLMPEVTLWEAFMPDYLDYHFNSEQWLGSKTDIKISLFCDIIADMIDLTNGHGMYSTDEHFEDALYDILDIDLYSYASVQRVAGAKNDKLSDFIQSKTFSRVFAQNIEIGQELYDGYADYLLTIRSAIDDVNERYQFLLGNYNTATDVGKRINKTICEQVWLQNTGDELVGVAVVALDTAYNVYRLMCYDEDSRTLFSRCISDEVEEFTEYKVEYLKKVTQKISSDIKSDQAIVATTVINEALEWIYSEIRDKGIEEAASAFSGGNIYVFAAKLGVLLTNIWFRETLDAFSDHMDMLWLATTQTDVAKLASHYVLSAFRDEKGSNTEHLLMLTNLMTLYYRTTIAFCENAIVACEEFGDIKSKATTIEYLGQVADYMAEYLYLITNSVVVPIVDYSSLFDSVLTEQWVLDVSITDSPDIEFDISSAMTNYLIGSWDSDDGKHRLIFETTGLDIAWTRDGPKNADGIIKVMDLRSDEIRTGAYIISSGKLILYLDLSPKEYNFSLIDDVLIISGVTYHPQKKSPTEAALEEILCGTWTFGEGTFQEFYVFNENGTYQYYSSKTHYDISYPSQDGFYEIQNSDTIYLYPDRTALPFVVEYDTEKGLECSVDHFFRKITA